MNKENRSYHILLHVTILIFGLTGVLGKLINLSAEVIVWYRVAIGFLGILLYMIYTRSSFRITTKDLFTLSLIGLIIAGHWITFFGSIKQSNVSVALISMSSSTFFTALIEPFYFKRKIKFYQLLLGVIIIFAISLIFAIDLEYKLGILLGLISAFLASLFTVLNGQLVQRMDASPISLYQMGSAFVFVSLYLLFIHTGISDIELVSSDVIYLVILGLVCTSFAFVASVAVMKKISPFTVSMSVNLEPIYTIVLAIIIWPESEIMPPRFYFSVIIILISIFINSYLSGRTSNNNVTLID